MTTQGDSDPSAPTRPSPAMLRHYREFREGCGVVDCGDRTQLELTGRDRQSFLHNLCTQEIKRLAPGQGCEAFVTSVQGRCLGYILVFCTESAILIDTEPAQAAALLPHFEKYHITEDVQLVDRSQDWSELLLIGPSALDVLSRFASVRDLAEVPEGAKAPDWATVLEGDYGHTTIRSGDLPCRVRRVPMADAPCLSVSFERAHQDDVANGLRQAGGLFGEDPAAAAAAFEMARVEIGFPRYGWDITDRNLPQEVNRNERAISFQKGCYLGQETVARLDALGHVNRLFIGLRCAGDARRGDPLEVAGQSVGEVTSAAFSPRAESVIARAYLRSQYTQPGTIVILPSGPAEVISAPLR